MYSSFSNSDSTDPPEEDEEGKLYQFIFELGTTTNVQEEKEQIEVSFSPLVHVKTDPGRTPQAVIANKKDDMEVLDNIEEIPRVKADATEKPWRNPGSNISDYFNYGFDEQSWNTYCKKQAEARSAHRKLYTEIMVATKMSHEEDRFNHLSSLNFPFAYIPPPPFLYRSGPPPPSSLATLDRDSQGFDGLLTVRPAHSSDVPSFIPRCMTSNAGVINTAKAWECYLWEEKCEKNRERSRERGRDEDSHRGRDRDREDCFPSHSKEEQVRHRDTAEPGRKRTYDRYNGERGRNREKRHRDSKDGWQRPSSSRSRCCSSRKRGRDSGEDRDGPRKSKIKKKRNRKGKKSDRTSSADQESQEIKI